MAVRADRRVKQGTAFGAISTQRRLVERSNGMILVLEKYLKFIGRRTNKVKEVI